MLTPHTSPDYIRVEAPLFTNQPTTPSAFPEQLIRVGCVECDNLHKQTHPDDAYDTQHTYSAWFPLDHVHEAISNAEHTHYHAEQQGKLNHSSIAVVLDSTGLPLNGEMSAHTTQLFAHAYQDLTNAEKHIYTAYCVAQADSLSEIPTAQECFDNYIGLYPNIESYAVEHAVNTDMFTDIEYNNIQRYIDTLNWSDYADLIADTVYFAPSPYSDSDALYVFTKQ